MSMTEELQKRTEEIEAIISAYLPQPEGMNRTVTEAMRYSYFAGGKRLRPMLMQETFRLFGGESELLHPFMAAIEMIHTYSLIHDDLPAMDNDDYRRGKKTSHIVFGEAMAILAGDALLNLAFETMSHAAAQSTEPVKGIRALSLIAEKAGYSGMVGGQCADVELEGQPLSAEALSYIHEKKTACLIEAAMGAGAILAGAEPEEAEQVLKSAFEVGLAFQIRDDILDVAGDAEIIGKPVGSDARNEKTTWVTLYGLERSEEMVQGYSDAALARIRNLPGSNPFLEELLLYLVHRDH